MLGYLSADIICSEKRTVFRERSPRKTVSFDGTDNVQGKYPSIFSPQMETIVFIILQIFYATRAVLKIGGYLTISKFSAPNIAFLAFWLAKKLRLFKNYSMSPRWIWSDKITNERVARVGYNHFICNKGEWNNCFSKFSNRVLPPIFFPQFYKAKIFTLGALFSIWRRTPNIGS